MNTHKLKKKKRKKTFSISSCHNIKTKWNIFINVVTSRHSFTIFLFSPPLAQDGSVIQDSTHPTAIGFFALFVYHHHHVVPLAWISLTLSRHFSLSFITSGRSLALHPVSSHNCCMYVRAGRPAFAWRGSIGVHHWWVRTCFTLDYGHQLILYLYVYRYVFTQPLCTSWMKHKVNF